jgi:hypothetical protein
MPLGRRVRFPKQYNNLGLLVRLVSKKCERSFQEMRAYVRSSDGGNLVLTPDRPTDEDQE